MNSFYELRKIPFVRLVIPLLIGITGGMHLKMPVTFMPVIACVLSSFFMIIILIARLSGNYKYRLLFGFSINTFIVISGIVLVHLKLDMNEEIVERIKSSEYFICRVVDRTGPCRVSVKVPLKIIGYKERGSWKRCNIGMLAYFQADGNAASLKGGDIVIMAAELREINNPGNPFEFDYAKFQKFKGFIFQSFPRTGRWKRIGHREGLKTIAFAMRDRLLGLYEKYGIRGNEYAVVSAFTLGCKDSLNPLMIKSFATAGAMHFIAVSGLHVGIIFYILNILFRFPRKKMWLRGLKTALIIVILWFYALITGLSPSVIRATVMFTIIQAGISLNRPVNIYNVLAATAYFMLLSDPSQLSEMGFQLSFISVLGIVFFQPRLYRLLIFKNTLADRIWSLFTASLAAQAAVLPAVIFYFHRLPVFGWLTNILIIIPVALSIYLSILLFIFSWAGRMAYFIAAAINILLRFIILCITSIEHIPFAAVENIHSNSLITILLYIVIISAGMLIVFRNRLLINVPLLCAIALLSINLVRNCSLSRQKKIVIFNVKRITAINFIEGRSSYLYTDADTQDGRRYLNSAAYNYWLNRGVIRRNRIININEDWQQNTDISNISRLHVCRLHGNIMINFRGTRLLLLYNDKLLEQIYRTKFKIDYLIVSHDYRPADNTMQYLSGIDNLIVDSSNNKGTEIIWAEICRLYGIKCKVISLEGALKIDIASK
jgi:competence protein ComEC